MPNYLDRIQKRLDSLWVDLAVLVWGPGETAKPEWFEKRAKVVDALKTASRGRDQVYTSEEIFRALNHPALEPGRLEIIHAEEADVIIALVMASPDRQGGVYRELEIVAPYEELRRKVWIFLPEEKKWLERFAAGSLAQYPEHQKISLAWSAFETCEHLRANCISKVEEARKIRMYDKLGARRRARGPGRS